MFFWFAAFSVVVVVAVFDSPAMDYRYVVAGSVLPVIEVILGHPFVLHTLLGSVGMLVAVVLGTRGRRLAARRLVGLPIGLFLHLVADGTWSNATLFWWPFLGGGAFQSREVPEVAHLGVSLVLELVGIVGTVVLVRTYRLTERGPPRAVPPNGPPRIDIEESRMLIIVRHGRTAANAAGQLLGRRDVGLDDTGRSQAQAIAAVVGTVDAVVSSPLLRAHETAEALGRPIEIDDRWIELDYGEWDGTPSADIGPRTWAHWRSDVDFAPPGGESLRSLGLRVRAACTDLAHRAVDEDIVVVTHVSPIKATFAWALGVGDEVSWRCFVAPGSIMRIAVAPTGTSLRSFNETPDRPA